MKFISPKSWNLMIEAEDLTVEMRIQEEPEEKEH
jgi:hypothetical protein